MARRKLADQWLVLSIGALATSGALAVPLVAARTPWIAQHFTATDFARRVLVVHVGLAVVVWFSALPVALFHLHPPGATTATPANRLATVAPWISGVGALMLLTGLLPGAGLPHSVNYVPLVTQPFYVVGLALFLAGVAMSYLDRSILGWRRGDARPSAHPQSALAPPVATTLAAGGGLVRIGALYVLLAVGALLVTFFRLPPGLADETRLEILMWAPGHMLQFANVAFVLVAWALLVSWGTGRPVDGRAPLRWMWGVLAASLVPVAYLLFRGPSWWGFRNGFTTLMQWGLFPPILLFLGYLLVRRTRADEPTKVTGSKVLRWPLGASVALMLMGFVYGGLIRGSDLRIPGHYHACIGAVTLAFMALTLLLPIAGTSADPARLPLRAMSLLYGCGQSLFSTGLMFAGGYGVGRKIYGVEQQLDRTGQLMALLVMATGGLLAFAGGAVWAVAAVRRIRAAYGAPAEIPDTGAATG